MAADISDDCVQGLANLFGIIAVSRCRKLAVTCMHYRFLCLYEGRFLQLMSLLQRKDKASAEDILLNWVPPAAARLSIPHAQAQAEALFTEHPHYPVPAYLH